MDDGLLSLLPQRIALPRGRAALSESEVAESRRGRILQATLDEVAESGYADTSVAAITKRAHVSRTSFYAAFADKEEAFGAAHWNASELALKRVWQPAFSGDGVDFDSRMLTAISAYVHSLERAPAFTICFYVEIRAAGARLMLQRDDILDRHIAILADLAAASAQEWSITVPPPDVLRGLMGSLDELVARQVRAQRHEEQLVLQSVIDPFVKILLPVMHDR